MRTREFIESLRTLIILQCPLIGVRTWEEERFMSILSRLLKGWTIMRFSLAGGLQGGEEGGATEDPMAALRYLSDHEGPAALVIHDPEALWKGSGQARLVRAIREFAHATRKNGTCVLFTSPYMDLPEILQREAQVLTMPLPDLEEIRSSLSHFFETLNVEVDDAWMDHAAALMRGLTEREIAFAVQRARRSLKGTSRETILEALLAEKTELVRTGGVVDPIEVREGVSGIGGLDNLKDWLQMREKFIRSYLKGESTFMPRGVLLMGVSGCGKSLSVKAIADIWKLPLFKLDMNLVFSERYGNAERIFYEALEFMENVAPAILWLDEIEMGLSARAESGTAARIFAHFLTWMQERRSLVFVAATANRIDLLPAELIRRGRFDQIFFVDLPSDGERKEIFQVHLERRGQDIGKFDFITLSEATKSFSGAEIEQCVVSALAAAVAEGRELTQDDVYWEIHHIIPLATTMDEQIKSIRSWARKRAVQASKSG